MFNSCKEKKLEVSHSPKSHSSCFERYLIGGRYKVEKKIGSGSYGQIRLGTDTKTKEKVAIKFEAIACSDPQLKMENQIYQLLHGRTGFPIIYFFGQYLDYTVLVMQMLGRNLESVFDYCDRRFGLKTNLYLTVQLLRRFEVIHQCRIVYRDVKPENIMLGPGTNTVYIIDFGLSKSYIDPVTKQHIPYVATHELIGTSRYMSVRAHQGKEQSRRDDLEALCYVWAYFFRGKLPWSGLRASNFKKHNQMITDIKQDFPEEELYKGAPRDYVDFLKYVKQLEFDQTPDYLNWRNKFKMIFFQKFQNDGDYEWN